MQVNDTLNERVERYGKFRKHAELSQKLKQMQVNDTLIDLQLQGDDK